MIKSLLTILILSALCLSYAAEYIEADCEHDCECEASHSCVCESCSTFLTMITTDVNLFDDYSIFIAFSESFYPVFTDQEYLNGIDRPPRLA